MGKDFWSALDTVEKFKSPYSNPSFSILYVYLRLHISKGLNYCDKSFYM